MKQTLVIGSSVVDIIVRVPRLPKRAEDIHILSQQFSLGGCAYLVSDILRHFQVPYSLCTAVGGNIYGRFVEEELRRRQVPIYVPRPEGENGCCYCMVDDSGERTFLVSHGIEYTFYEEYLHHIDTASIDSVYICGLEIEEYTGWNIIRYLQKHPDWTIYFAPGPRILSIPQEKLEAIFPLHPILHLNEQESLDFTRAATAQDAARAIYAVTQNTVFITLGSKGALAYDGTAFYTAGAFPTQVEDTIGAGDSHIGALIASHRLGLTLQEALTAANAISSLVVRQKGGLLDDEAFRSAKELLPPKLLTKILENNF